MDNPGASTKTAGEAAEGSKDKSGLYGWEGLEQHVLKDDKGKMDGYSKDIDTLLVFAGLFSAILSAFVVQTYPMLQPSPTSITNQLLAANNKMLVQGFSALLSQPIPSPSMFTLEDPAPFQVSTAAQWINCLFFVSLVLSLAAAMIGILVQQWIREYMQWNSALAQPRENILVRQFRFEAWESWNVSAVISTVPALLEIAMILFLVGMVILLWTLDSVVAICLTAVTISFLLVIAIFTVLPVFARRCPYKSPTAWAIILAWNSFHNSVMFAMQWCNNNILSRRWKYFCATLQGPGTSGAQYAIELPTLPGRQLLPASVTQPHIPRSMQPSFAILQPIGRFVQRLLKVVVMGVSDKHLRKRDPVIWVDPPLRWREFDIGNIHNTPINLGGHLSNSHIMRRIEDIIVQPIIDTIHWTNARAIEDLIIDTAEEYSMPLEMRNSMPDATSLSQSSKAHYISPLASLRELCIIFRALQWASKSSQSLHVIRYITQCAYALPANNPASWEQYWPVNLSSFLSVSNRVASGLVAQANAGIWQQYLLQHISIAASKAGVKGDELLPHYTLALEAYALTYDVQKGCLRE
ncbi:hypothetical protein PsYK624_118410 [Phanerochaete sordida]|uniref:DUF6535 domain-containing protein n=1 Tax=Phanerochaete sordida TaxID=48140 RepID=A0A9P3GLE6_9APHY|nr:hypothetical protein PsYK624_118410 [Phanerochaete sordida]